MGSALIRKAGYGRLWLVMWLLSLPGLVLASNWASVANDVISEIDAAERAYLAGDAKEARRAIMGAYFGVFEDRKMEAAMRMELGAKHTYQVESLFGDMRKAVKKGLDGEQVSAIAELIREAMRRDAALLDEAGIPLTVFKVNQ